MQERHVRGSGGFTLIEIVGIMVIVGVLASIFAAKVFEVDSTVKREALTAAVADLNSRERLTWANVKMSNSNWLNDTQVFTLLDTHIGPEYHWNSISATGGSLLFKELISSLRRTASTNSSPGIWEYN